VEDDVWGAAQFFEIWRIKAKVMERNEARQKLFW
jgi:hypothetical protein